MGLPSKICDPTTQEMVVVVFPILLAVSLSMLVPLIVDKVWQCRESEQVVEKVDREIRLFYPWYTNANWEYLKN